MFFGIRKKLLTLLSKVIFSSLSPRFGFRFSLIEILFVYLQGRKVKVPTFLVPATQKVSTTFRHCYYFKWFYHRIQISNAIYQYIWSPLQVWMDVYALPVPGSGGKTCAQIFEEAGCDTPASPSCGACLGGPADTYARLNEPQVCTRFLP